MKQFVQYAEQHIAPQTRPHFCSTFVLLPFYLVIFCSLVRCTFVLLGFCFCSTFRSTTVLLGNFFCSMFRSTSIVIPFYLVTFWFFFLFLFRPTGLSSFLFYIFCSTSVLLLFY